MEPIGIPGLISNRILSEIHLSFLCLALQTDFSGQYVRARFAVTSYEQTLWKKENMNCGRTLLCFISLILLENAVVLGILSLSAHVKCYCQF